MLNEARAIVHSDEIHTGTTMDGEATRGGTIDFLRQVLLPSPTNPNNGTRYVAKSEVI
jgi:hypothetical protein